MSNFQALCRDVGLVRRTVLLLKPHLAQIRSAWEKALSNVGISGEAWKQLSPLLLESHSDTLQKGRMEIYREALEQQGRALEETGLSEGETSVCFHTYLGCCLPYLLKEQAKSKESVLCATRLTSVALYATFAGFESERVSNWRKLQERERLSFARDLHDDIGHSLLVLKLYLELMATDLTGADLVSLQAKLEEALGLVSTAVDSVRRLILDLGPAPLSQFGLIGAMKIYSRQFATRTGIAVQLVEGKFPEDLPSNYETALYRVIQGALSNVVQHSHAKHVTISLGGTKQRALIMNIEDDGTGFDLPNTLPQKAFGLTAMRERVEMLGGKFHIESWQNINGGRKHGTRIHVELPLRTDIATV